MLHAQDALWSTRPVDSRIPASICDLLVKINCVLKATVFGKSSWSGCSCQLAIIYLLYYTGVTGRGLQAASKDSPAIRSAAEGLLIRFGKVQQPVLRINVVKTAGRQITRARQSGD